MTDPTTWTVVLDDENHEWVIATAGPDTTDGIFIQVETIRSHYDATEVLAIVEARAGQSLLWLLTPDGFAGSVPVDPARPLTHAQADTLRAHAQAAILSAHKRGYALAQDHLTPADDAATLAAYTVANATVMDAISGLEVHP
jgi:hypothetical protein